MMDTFDLEKAVKKRYAEASQAKENALCCPVDYDPKFLKVIPQEVLDRDYGCGDPSAHLKPGETVLDLGSGGGKICFIASQVVGPTGRVIGIDFGEEMLSLARKARPMVSKLIGFDNVEFRKGRIQDLALDLELLEEHLKSAPVNSLDSYLELKSLENQLRKTSPLVPSASIDVVVSNCVLNLVEPEQKHSLFKEMHRVLKRGGRAVISDIVSDEDVPDHLVNDSELFSGCVSGALREDRFLDAFAQAGLYGIEILKRDESPWATVDGIEFRAVTVAAYKGKEGACWDHHEAVVYRGPWKSVEDDDGHTLYRGQRMAVCRKTFEIYSRHPYRDHVVPVRPLNEVSADAAELFACDQDALRPVQVTKGKDYNVTVVPTKDGCGPEGCC